MKICFDVDGVVVDKKGKSIKENVGLIRLISRSHKVFLWSGNGFSYAYDIAKKTGLDTHIHGVMNKYNTFTPDVAVDDQEITLGTVNVTL